MSIDFRLPNITAKDEAGQLIQMKSYLHQLVEQLNYAMKTVESSSSGAVAYQNKATTAAAGEDAKSQATFNSIKSLIIKSADIVQAYEETIFEDFNGKYFADSDFGTYLAETNKTVTDNSEYTKEVYTKVETITNEDGTGSLDELQKETKTTNAYIKRGALGYHERLKKDVYGIAVGQTDDNGVYNKYAWFISDGLCLFDENGQEVAYVSQNKLYITDAVFLGTIQFGKYKMDTSDGVAFTWIG